MKLPERLLAIDWSGAASAATQRRTIVAAEVDAVYMGSDDVGRDKMASCDVDASNIADPHKSVHVDTGNIQLHAGRTRQELLGWLIENSTTHLKSSVIGFDFSFSLPASFSRQKGCCSAPELWKLIAQEGEGWLRASPSPFWGRPGKKRPPMAPEEALRETERRINVDGIRPKSTFQIGGAGAAGTGSLRGMPLLLELRRAGFSIWPFDPPRLPMVVEIYPRLLTGAVRKSNAEERLRYLEGPRFAALPKAVRRAAAGSEDAFDALVSALAMAEHAAEFCCLGQATEPVERLEGRIWRPEAKADQEG